MNREIKFRAWNGQNMVDLKKATPLALAKGFNMDGIFIPFYKDYEIMQYTGLKDKNGVEIYEGDIVTFTRGVGNWTGKTLTTTHEVYYSDVICAFVLKGQGDYIKLRRLENRYIYEVIGNIYENKDLLT